MTQQRPSLEKKITRKTEEKRNAELERGVRFTIGEDVYDVRVGDLSALDSLEFRRQVGVPFVKVIDEVEESFDLDYLAALMWMARRIKGERSLTFEDVAAEVRYSDLERLEVGGDDPTEDASPEA